MNRRFEEWVNGKISDEAFWTEADAIQSAGAKAFAANMGLDTADWNIVY